MYGRWNIDYCGGGLSKMSDFINKVVTIILIFVLLIIAPLVNMYTSEYEMAKQKILYDTSSFIDQVVDDKYISDDDLNSFYAQCNSHGIAVNVSVKRLIRSDVPNVDKTETKIVYYSSDVSNTTEFNSNDVVKIDVSEVGISTARRLMYSVMRFDSGKFELSLAREVK